MLSDERRGAIATFLKVRRTRRQPEEVGLPRGGRRRTPGLRREEVAALAGVSTEWYTWLEQARDVRPSPDTLRRIAVALRLEPGETQHLLTLAGHGLEDGIVPGPRPRAVSPVVDRLLEELEYCPAWVYGERWDILAWNRAATVIYGDLSALEGIERNGLYLLFVHPRMRSMLRDWQVHARVCVAKLRADYARHVDDPWFNELVELLRTRSPEFASMWEDHAVAQGGDGVKHYDHREGGRLTFDFTVLGLTDDLLTSLRLVVHIPAPGSGTREKMEGLLGHAGIGS